MPPTIYLLDGHALAYRTYFALTRGSSTSFSTRTGEQTAGVYGFASVLLRIFEQEDPDYIAVAFDTGRTFRDDLYPEYKGTRQKMPDDLSSQIDRVRQLVDAFNIPRIELEGYEADDVLGSLAKKAVENGLGVKIITGDRDLLQLVDDRIIVNLPGKTLSEARDYRSADVLEYLGVLPAQVVDFKALVGDKSDNIPGVAGIGDKTATNLLKTYGTLDGIYEHIEELKGSVKARLEAGKDSAYLSQKLATIVTDLNVRLDLEKAKAGSFDPKTIEGIFRELEFRSLLPRLIELEKRVQKMPTTGQQLSLFGGKVEVIGGQTPSSAEQINAKIIDTPQALEMLVRRLESSKVISVDTETTSPDQMRADLVGISLAVEGRQGYYIPVGHKPGTGRQLPLETVIEALQKPLTDPGIQKVGHNLKYDFVVLARYGLHMRPLSFDTMIAEWLTNPISRNLGLKSLAWVRLDRKMTQITDLIGKGKNQVTMAEVPIPDASAYAAEDAEVVFELLPDLKKELENCHAVSLLEEIEMPLVTVLADMEMTGISLDTEFLAKMSAEVQERMLALEDRVHQAVGEPFNLNSTQQLSNALFDRLRLAPPDRTKRTASGHFSTSADVLEAMRGKHPVVDSILEYRELSKLKSTYIDALPLQVLSKTGRLHTNYNQAGAITGRIASADPNLQNIPIRSELGRRVRKAFIAQPGHKLISVDYSQVELRIAAHMSNDEAMLSVFRAGHDIHAATAAAIYKVPIEKVTKEQRRRAKGINFGLIYGMSAFGLTRYTDLTLAESEDFMEEYFRQFPGIKGYLDGIRRVASTQGYVETLLGRRRYFPGLMDPKNYTTRNREEREAINAPIQGTAADIMKIAMLRVPDAIKEAGLSGHMLLQVHDELVIESPDDEVQRTAEIVREVMENAYPISAGLKADARCGRNWDDMEPIL
ncbi:MAG: DNA polymerase I [Chloroflexi bacterium]|nr:MAG: DNA polymerase I [Chloroflexota bacterium]